MTQIRLEQRQPGPGTHVLIVGVGDYSHLDGGRDPHPSVNLDLSVLTSPPCSAEMIARWFLGTGGTGDFFCTLDVIISSRTPISLVHDGQTYVAERATLANIQAGFDRWLDEVESNEDNIAVIYFCGHGIMKEPRHYLLVEDFAVDKRKQFSKGIFDITSTFSALTHTVRAQLYVFIDACREAERHLATSIGGNPRALLNAQETTDPKCRGAVLINACGPGLHSFGDSKGGSFFANALLLALQGYCGTKQPGVNRWLVNGAALVWAVPRLVPFVSGRRQSCDPGHPYNMEDIPLHIRLDPPMVKVEIETSPDELKRDDGGMFVMRDLVDSNNRIEEKIQVGKATARDGKYGILVFSRTKLFSDVDHPSEEVKTPIYCLPVTLKPVLP